MRDVSKHVNGEGIQRWKLKLLPELLCHDLVLDAGSGVSEPYRQVFEEMGARYVSVDIRPGAMVQGDVTCLPFPDQAFDYCWASELLEHLGSPEIAHKALAELRRVAKHGCATWPTPSHPNFYADPGHSDPGITPDTITRAGEGILVW